MKKLFAIVAVAGMLAACNDSASTDAVKPVDSPAVVTSAPDTTHTVVDSTKVTVDSTKVTVDTTKK